jgi:hypothetical protein
MSVAIATGGMFRDCCGGGGVGYGGGAPYIGELSEKRKFSATVTDVYFEDKKKLDESKGLSVIIKNIIDEE